MSQRVQSNLPIVLALGLVLTLGCTSQEEQLQQALSEAEAYSEAHEFERAEVALRSALQLVPNDAEVNERLALVLERQQKFSDAIFYYEESYRMAPERSSPALALVRLLLGEDLPRAEELIAEVLERDPTDARAYVARSSVALIDEEVNEALAFATTATELDPDDARAWLGLATVHQAAIRQARLDREEVDIADFEAAEAALSRAIELEGPLTLYGHERARLRSIWPGRAEEAAPLLRELVENPDSTLDARAAAAQTLLEYGVRRDDLEAVRTAVPVLVELDSSRIESWEMWARVEEVAEKGGGEAVLRRLVEARPRDLRSYVSLATYLGASGRTDEALVFLRESMESMENPAPLIAREALLLHQVGRKAERDEVRARLLAEHPDDIYTQLVEARIAYDEGNIERATELYRRLANEIPSVEVYQFLAYCELKNRNLPAAEEAIRSAMSMRERFQPKLARVRAAIRYQARDWVRLIRTLRAIRLSGARIRPNELVWLAEANYGLNKPESGRKVLETVLALESPPFRAVTVFVQFELRNDPDAVAEVVARARERHPDHASLSLFEAQIALARGDATGAEEILDEVIERDPPPGGALLLRGRLRLSAGDNAGAEADARRVLELDPGNGAATRLMLRALTRDNRIADMVTSLEADAEAGRIGIVGKRTLASLYTNDQENERALALYEEILAEVPDDAWSQNAIAYLLARKGESLDRALDLARSAVGSIPDNAQTADTLGYVYLAKKLLEPALGQFDAALRVADPRNAGLVATIRAHRGMALEALGRQEDAEADFAMALELDPEIDLAEQKPATAGT